MYQSKSIHLLFIQVYSDQAFSCEYCGRKKEEEN